MLSARQEAVVQLLSCCQLPLSGLLKWYHAGCISAAALPASDDLSLIPRQHLIWVNPPLYNTNLA